MACSIRRSVSAHARTKSLEHRIVSSRSRAAKLVVGGAYHTWRANVRSQAGARRETTSAALSGRDAFLRGLVFRRQKSHIGKTKVVNFPQRVAAAAIASRRREPDILSRGALRNIVTANLARRPGLRRAYLGMINSALFEERAIADFTTATTFGLSQIAPSLFARGNTRIFVSTDGARTHRSRSAHPLSPPPASGCRAA